MIIFISILLFLFQQKNTMSISAIEQSCPFRTGMQKDNEGSIYILDGQQNFEVSRINFDSILNNSPNGVIISPRCIEIAETSSSKIDYNFTATNITITGFDIIVTLNMVYTLGYVRIILNYWTNSPFSKQTCFTRLPLDNYTQQLISSSKRQYKWILPVNDDINTWSGAFFIPEVIGNFPTNDITLSQIAPQHNKPGMTITLAYELNSNSIITSFKICGIIYAYSFQNGTNYLFKLKLLNLYESTQILYFTDNDGDVTLFVGVGTIQVQNHGNPNKIGFYIGYDQENTQNNYLIYRQNQPYLYLNKIQSSNPTVRYAGRLLTYTRTQCSSTIYKYLQGSTQLCHDKCPVKKYADSSNRCMSCINCTNLNSCNQCYSNGCQSGYFIQPTHSATSPYQKCSHCLTFINNCNSCFTNSSGGPYCNQCNPFYTLNITAKTCFLCNQQINNCQICSEDGLTCKNCTIASQHQVFDGKCQPCNQISYYNAASRTCKNCNQTLSNCQFCIFNTNILCTGCIIGSQTQLIDSTCRVCNITSYFHPLDKKCYLCSNAIEDCLYCKYSIPRIQCTLCNHLMKKQLKNNYCIVCNHTSFYQFTNYSCISCANVVQNCSQCIYENSQVNCTKCLSFAIIKDRICQSCNSSSFRNISDTVCYVCSQIVPECSSCRYNQVISQVQCLSCYSNYVNGICISCSINEYFDQNLLLCISCKSKIANCLQCELVISQNTLQCLNCNSSLFVELKDRICKPCIASMYFDETAKYCKNCSPYCQICTSQTYCSTCILTQQISTVNQNGKCRRCNPNRSDIQSQFYPCKIQQLCPYSTYNPQTKSCQMSKVVQQTIYGLTYLASVPNLNMLSTAISSLISFFDDFSYYSYHKRNYSDGVTTFFNIMRNFTVMRFIPFQLNQLYDSIQLSYNASILPIDLDKTPQQFQQNDNSIYFIVTTQSLWAKSLIINILIFFVLMFIHWFSNKFYPNNIFKKYSYFGVLIANFVNSNMQFLSFHCFAQLYQIVPLTKKYYLNIIFCYINLFIIITFMCTAVSTLKIIYQKLKTQYILLNIYGQQFNPWFIIQSISKVITALIHSCFYYQPFVQSLLLISIFLVKACVFSYFVKKLNNKLEFALKILSCYSLCVLQGFFVLQIFMTQFYGYKQVELQHSDDIECFLIILMGVCEISMIVFLPLRAMIFYLISKFANYQITSRNQVDIWIYKYINIKGKIKKKKVIVESGVIRDKYCKAVSDLKNIKINENNKRLCSLKDHLNKMNNIRANMNSLFRTQTNNAPSQLSFRLYQQQSDQVSKTKILYRPKSLFKSRSNIQPKQSQLKILKQNKSFSLSKKQSGLTPSLAPTPVFQFKQSALSVKDEQKGKLRG